MSPPPKTVGARELKTRLGRYLRYVQRGIHIVVTERGRPVAELVPLPDESSDLDSALDALSARGELTRASLDELPDFEPARVGGAMMSDVVAAGREDRF